MGSPADVSLRLQEAEALARAGRRSEAKAACDLILAQSPALFDALQLAGSLALQDGDAAAAVDYFARAVGVEPKHAGALFSLGNAFMLIRRPAEAEVRYAKAAALKPNSAPIHCNRGVALTALNRAEAAVASLDKALALKPFFFEALKSRGNALAALGRIDAAVADYDRALVVNPGDVATLVERGHALLTAKRFTSAADSFSVAFAFRPSYCLRLQRLHARMGACDWEEFDEDVRALEDLPAQEPRRTSPYPLMAICDSAAKLRAAAAGFAQARFPEDPGLGPIPRGDRGGRIRIGYFSPDFRSHPVAHLLVETLERHDRSKFEIAAFSFGPDLKDDVRKRIQAACELFLDVRGDSDRDIAAQARRLGIDVAVDLSGTTASGRLGIFALRAAPVQVNYLGCPGTLGASYMDYLIADRVVIPEASRGFYAEKIVALPHCYMPGDRKRPVAVTAPDRAAYGLPRDGVVFCAFHNSFKITPRMFECWMNTLRAVSGSVLWLRFDGDAPADNLRREAARRGVESHRLVFAHHVPMAEHMARHRLADVFLDTFPYNAHSTANDALWMGLPVITLMGQSYAARVAASLLTTVGLPEMIAQDHASYQALAIALAGDPARRARLKEQLAAARAASPLFDTPAYTRHLEAAFTAMAERHNAGLAPDHIQIAP